MWNYQIKFFNAINLIFCLLILIFSGCYATEVVEIKVGVDSKIEMKKYKTIAVMDFIDKKSKSNEINGKIVARMIRKQLKINKGFSVLEEKLMEFEGGINEDEINDPKFLTSISSQLGVDALIVGDFEFYQKYQSVPYIAERYSSTTGKYTPEGRSYVQRVYGFAFRARVIDGATGETVFSFTPRAEERPEYRESGSLTLSDGTNDPANLRNMAVKPINNFVLSLVPHYEKERRTLIK